MPYVYRLIQLLKYDINTKLVNEDGKKIIQETKEEPIYININRRFDLVVVVIKY